MTDVAPCGCLAAKFDLCNSLLSSVHTLPVNILRCVRLYIKRKYKKTMPTYRLICHVGLMLSLSYHLQKGRYYVRKSTRGNHSSENLNKALADLQEGQSYHSVSRKYAIPRRTLQRHMKCSVREPGCAKLGRFRTI